VRFCRAGFFLFAVIIRRRIAEAPAIEPKVRGVLDRPVKPGDDRFARDRRRGFLS
jgi:hypothetical protein